MTLESLILFGLVVFFSGIVAGALFDFPRQHPVHLCIGGLTLILSAVGIAFTSVFAYVWWFSGSFIAGIALGGWLVLRLSREEYRHSTQLPFDTNLEVCPLRVRLIAGGLDAAALWIVWVVLTLLLDDLLAWMLMLAVVPLYSTLLSILIGSSLGKVAVRCHVVNSRGEPAGVMPMLTRSIGLLASLVNLGLGLLFVTVDPKRQAFHDHISATYVVRPR